MVNSDQIESHINQLVDAGKAVGIVVGMVNDRSQRVFGCGRLDFSRLGQPDSETVFEIGSITKVLTALLLTDMVTRGEVQLDDAVAQYLPCGVRVPQRNGRHITLINLAMQISGLPRIPFSLGMLLHRSNPYAHFDTGRMYRFLSRYKLRRDIGSRYEYSNLGAGLLGHALSLRLGQNYEHAVRERILQPLGMTTTSITLPESKRNQLAHGHNARLRPVSNWDMDALAGAGALRFTAKDMLTFLAARLELLNTPLQPAMRMMLSLRCDGPQDYRTWRSLWPGTSLPDAAWRLSGTMAVPEDTGLSLASILGARRQW